MTTKIDLNMNDGSKCISNTLRQFIEALAEEVVLEGKPFESQKRWLLRYCQVDGVDYATLETNLLDFFEIMEEWKRLHLKSSQLTAKMLAKDCYISDEVMRKLMGEVVSAPASINVERTSPSGSKTEFIDYRRLIRNGRIGEAELNGRLVVPCEWKYVEGFQEGLSRVKSEDGLNGFVDTMGNIVIPCKWESAYDFSEGLALVGNDRKEWFFIDKQGNIAIKCDSSYDSDLLGCGFHDGLALVEQGDKYGFMDKTGRVVIPCIWDDAYSFEEGLSTVQDESGRYGCIDTRGKLVIPCVYDDPLCFSDGIGTISGDDEDGGSYLIDKTGRKICNLGFECGMVTFQEGVGSIEEYGFIDKTGRLVIEDQWSPDFLGFSEGLAPTQDGYIDHSGRVVIHADWDDWKEFREGLAVVEDNGKYGYIDRNGRMVIPCIWEFAGSFSDGLAEVELAEKYYIINKEGKILCKVK